jgi:hypothetical protein
MLRVMGWDLQDFKILPDYGNSNNFMRLNSELERRHQQQKPEWFKEAQMQRRNVNFSLKSVTKPNPNKPKPKQNKLT